MSEVTELRPRYRFVSQLPEQEIRQRIKTALKDPEQNNQGLQQRSVAGQMILSFPAAKKHFWSPVMDINIESQGQGKSLVRVLMGPEPSIWTMFIFFYTMGGLAVLGGLVLGYSQYLLGHSMFWFLLIPAGLLWIGIFYAAALVGKNTARDQMEILKNFLEEAIGRPVFHEGEEGSVVV